MSTYYSEIDPEKCAWLRELMRAGVITDGEVDQRDIKLVSADDVRGFTRVHWFAGIGVWDYALTLAGWPAGKPIWTGSCPCPSFSCAGKGEGFSDPRHLWPDWFRLIRELRPATIFGEQVSSAIRHGWLDLVQADLEGEDYALGKAVLGACSVGGADIRQRVYWVADAEPERRQQRACTASAGIQPQAIGATERVQSTRGRSTSVMRLGLSERTRLERHPGDERDRNESGRLDENQTGSVAAASEPSRLADTTITRREEAREHGSGSPLLATRPEQRSGFGRLADPLCDGHDTEDRLTPISSSNREGQRLPERDRAES